MGSCLEKIKVDKGLKMKSEVYAFAARWASILRNPQEKNSILFQNACDVAKKICQECENFHIYASKVDDSSRRGASSAWNLARLNNALDEIDDVSSAGALLINYARSIATQNDEGKRTLNAAERASLISIFNRLATICDESDPDFSGNVEEINLVVNLARRNASTQKREEVEQRLVVKADRNFSFTELVLTKEEDEWLEGSRGQKGKLPAEEVVGLFKAVEEYFFNEERERLASNADGWTIVFQDDKGRRRRFSGPLCRDGNAQILDLSDLFRRTLGISNLYVFDSNERPDSLERIETSYDFVEEDSLQSRLHESISIDVPSNTLRHTIQYGDDTKVVKEYHNPEAMESLVKNLKGENPFGVVPSICDDPDFARNFSETTRRYDFTATTRKGKRWNYSGVYDQTELPDEWARFISQIETFKSKCEKGEMFLKSIYGRRPRQSDEFIYLSVVFENSYKTYYYLTDDDTIKVGDYVMVPVGNEEEEEMVQVVAKEYYTRAKAPRSPETTKYVLEKTKEITGDDRVVFL